MLAQGSRVPSARKPATLAAAALLVSNAAFAAGGLAGFGNHTLFGSLYLVSAVTAVPMIYALIVAVRGPGAALTLSGALLLGVAAIGHGAEAARSLAPSLDVGSAGPAVGAAESLGLVLGMLLLGGGLWRARIAPIWPGLLVLILLPVNRLPHGLTQQSTRSAIVVVATLWLAYELFAFDPESVEMTTHST